MKLMTDELMKSFAEQGDTSEKPAEEIMVIAKYFNPLGNQRWFATEYDPETRIFFGFADLGFPGCEELGSFSLDELESVSVGLGLGIERDLHFGEHTLQEVLDGLR